MLSFFFYISRRGRGSPKICCGRTTRRLSTFSRRRSVSTILFGSASTAVLCRVFSLLEKMWIPIRSMPARGRGSVCISLPICAHSRAALMWTVSLLFHCAKTAFMMLGTAVALKHSARICARDAPAAHTARPATAVVRCSRRLRFAAGGNYVFEHYSKIACGSADGILQIIATSKFAEGSRITAYGKRGAKEVVIYPAMWVEPRTANTIYVSDAYIKYAKPYAVQKILDNM